MLADFKENAPGETSEEIPFPSFLHFMPRLPYPLLFHRYPVLHFSAGVPSPGESEPLKALASALCYVRKLHLFGGVENESE